MSLPSSVYQLPGWCPVIKADRLHQLVIDSDADLSVELGVYGGRSYIPMALAHKARGKGRSVGIDPWLPVASIAHYEPNHPNYIWWANLDHEAIYRYVVNALQEHKLQAFADIKRCYSQDAPDAFADESIDVLHQDANHSEPTSCQEVELYHNKVKRGGHWVMDDTDWESTKKAQELILTKGYILAEDYKAWRVYRRV